MPYALVIVEDDHMMRMGLTKMINWAALGFQIEAVFSDGGEVLAYLEHSIPDVLLMDIKMFSTSGVEVAREIHEKGLPIRTVLLSGHRSFEYAQQAIDYGVAHYLLKPISIPKLREVFESLREQLDQDKSRSAAHQKAEDHIQKLVQYSKQQIVLETLLGRLTDPREIDQRLNMTDLRGSGVNPACMLLQFSIEEDKVYRALVGEYGSQEVEDQLERALQSMDGTFDYFPAESFRTRRTGLFWEKDGYDAVRSRPDDCRQIIEQMPGYLHMLTGLTVRVERLELFSHVAQLIHFQQAAINGSAAGRQGPEYYGRLSEQKKLLLTYIMQADDEAATSLLTAFLRLCEQKGLPFMRNQTVLFLTTSIEKLSNGDAALANELMGLVAPMGASAQAGVADLEAWAAQRIHVLTDHVQSRGRTAARNDFVGSVQKYIDDHYSEDISLTDAAEQVYLNPIYLSRIFKERTGMTFMEYLTQARMDAAAALLAEDKAYVYEICEKVGYHNVKHFYKVFRRVIGSSPTEYRAAVLGKARKSP